MKVYRIEHVRHAYGPLNERGIGYTGKAWSYFAHDHASYESIPLKDWIGPIPEYSDTCPDDLCMDIGGNLVFGLECLEELFVFFCEDTFDELKSFGFELMEFEAEAYCVFPDGQVIFDRDTATRTEATHEELFKYFNEIR